MFSQECFATIPPIPYRDSEIDVEKFNIIEDMNKVMFGRPELLFKVKLRKYSGNKIEIPLVFFLLLRGFNWKLMIKCTKWEI